VSGISQGEGTRQISPVPSVEGVPAVLALCWDSRSQWQGGPDCLIKTQEAASPKGCERLLNPGQYRYLKPGFNRAKGLQTPGVTLTLSR
jgi:hypothetical protein